MSGSSSLAISQSTYAKMYNAVCINHYGKKVSCSYNKERKEI